MRHKNSTHLNTNGLHLLSSFLIHRLRLAYLRSVDDPHGSRIISLDPSYQTNSYIVAASLADHQRWPELGFPSSPNLSEDEDEKDESAINHKARFRHSKLLKSHAVGPSTTRISGRTLHDGPMSDSENPHEEEIKNFISTNAPVEEQLVSVKAPTQLGAMGSWIDIDDKSDDEEKSDPVIQVKVQEPSAPAEAPVATVVQFIPKFKAAAEMEARRRLRIAARRGHQAPVAQPVQPAKPLSFDDSSSEEDVVESEESMDEFEDIGVAVTDIGDEFDPYVSIYYTCPACTTLKYWLQRLSCYPLGRCFRQCVGDNLEYVY